MSDTFTVKQIPKHCQNLTGWILIEVKIHKDLHNNDTCWWYCIMYCQRNTFWKTGEDSKFIIKYHLESALAIEQHKPTGFSGLLCSVYQQIIFCSIISDISWFYFLMSGASWLIIQLELFELHFDWGRYKHSQMKKTCSCSEGMEFCKGNNHLGSQV